jgi:hypothetical protein
MIIYDGIKDEFMRQMDEDLIAIELRDTIKEKMHRSTSESEYNSWINSLVFMYKVLNDNEIPGNAGIAIEYNIPLTSKRIDFLISGYQDINKPNVIIIELKQWQKLNSVDGLDALVETYTGHSLRKVVHPSYQAWSYAKMIEDYNQTAQDNDISINPCAYLHNYMREDNDPIDEIQYQDYLDRAPAFTKGQVSGLRKFIKNKVKFGDHKDILYDIDHGKIRPSKSLQDCILKMVKGNKEFIMIDEQKVIYEQAMIAAKKSKRDNKKRVIIVKGGPGTGKTVVAINMLCDLTNENQFIQYVSKNAAPRSVFKAKLKKEMKISSIDNMFKGSGSYTKMNNNYLDTIVVDEAHRLNRKSGLFQNLGENQIKEIIHSSKCSVFFIDESQRVTIKDIGSIDEIKKCANSENAELSIHELKSQFRCNGSDGYLSWLDDVLEIKETANFDLFGIDYDFRVMDTPNEVFNEIKIKNLINGKSRMVAGYCWNWIKEGKKDSQIHDIVINDFEMSWNLSSSTTYAIDDDSVNEIGCIHTTQGLEFDYVGVIIGNDMSYNDKHIITNYKERAKTDQSLKGIKSMAKKDLNKANQIADEIIKNTYRTLMTRGMKGCYIYCADKNLSDYFKNRLK